MFCTKCGKKNEVGKFCTHCGAALTLLQRKQRGHRGWWRVGLLVLLIVALISGGAVTWWQLHLTWPKLLSTFIPTLSYEIQLTGTVDQVETRGFTLREVKTQVGPEPCSLSELRVQGSPGAQTLHAGDQIQITATYYPRSCLVSLGSSSDSLKILVGAPLPIQIEGYVDQFKGSELILRDVRVLQGSSTPCTLDKLPVDVSTGTTSGTIAVGYRVSVTGQYLTDRCRVIVSVLKGSITVISVPIELKGVVSEGRGAQLILRNVSILSGPAPCTQGYVTVEAAGQRASLALLQPQLQVHVRGEYHPESCNVTADQGNDELDPLPTPVRLTGYVRGFTMSGNLGTISLQGSQVLEGPVPLCQWGNISVYVEIIGQQMLMGIGDYIEVSGQYHPDDCGALYDAKILSWRPAAQAPGNTTHPSPGAAWGRLWIWILGTIVLFVLGSQIL